MTDKQIYRRKSQNIRTLLRQVATSDFPARMKNRLAFELEVDEFVVDDTPVLIWRGDQLGKKAAGTALPLSGVLVLTNQRMRFAAVDDSAVVDVPVSAVRLTHVEEGAMTIVWPGTSGKEAATITFDSPRNQVMKRVRLQVLEGDKTVAAGPATPRITTWDRLTRHR